MYAVVESGSKQYKVEKDTVIRVDLLDAKAGDEVKLDKVLLVNSGDSVEIGHPFVKGAAVVCVVKSIARDPKVIAFKYKKRKSEKKMIGHRRETTVLLVKEITGA